MAIYDNIGRGYANTRQSDDRILVGILNIVKCWEVSTIADLGAGTGSYSSALGEKSYRVLAIEPSKTMRNQANVHLNVSWIDANAESLPLSNKSVDAVIIVLAIHHFTDYQQALKEAYRITKKGNILIFTYDPNMISKFWLTDYFPSLITDVNTTFVSIKKLVSVLKNITDREIKINPFPLPSDLKDSFAAVGWSRPKLYLDSNIRQGISAFSKIESDELNRGLSLLQEDLSLGIWDRKYQYLRNKNNYDVGYRFVYS